MHVYVRHKTKTNRIHRANGEPYEMDLLLAFALARLSMCYISLEYISFIAAAVENFVPES